MIRKARVLEVQRQTPHQVLRCEIVAAPPRQETGPAVSFQPGDNCRAICYQELLGNAEPGDIIQIEVSPLAKALGTGGEAMVLANETRLPADELPNPGHLVKARYTPHQKVVLGADEPDSPYHSLLRSADNLDGLPVLVTDLHSALPAIVAGFLHQNPRARLVYIQTDGGALPLAYSRTVAQMRESGSLAATITCGQCFGGDFEAVSFPSALFVASEVVKADAAIVSQGPGNLGTGTRWGYSGVDGAQFLHTASALNGHPIAVLRMSSGDARPRHYGISHHSLTMLTWMGLPPLDVVLPVFDLDNPVEKALADPKGTFAPLVTSQLSLLQEHHRVINHPTTGLYAALEAFPVKLSTMGRTLSEDPAAFLAAAAAGAYGATVPTRESKKPDTTPAPRS